MEKSICSEADLCTNCLAFAKAISARSSNFEPTGLSGYEGQGFWPPSITCRLCNMINSTKALRDRSLTAWQQQFENGPILIKYHTNATAAHSDQGPLSRVDLMSNCGSFILSIRFAAWCDDGNSQSSFHFPDFTYCSRVSDISEMVQDPPLPSDNCPESFALVRKWLRTCRLHHQQCVKTRFGPVVDEVHGPKLPTRVLDISKQDEGVVSLIESNGLQGDFCALSYCWGKGVHGMITTRETIADHYGGMKIDLLPQTFKDAIQLTSEIGIKYLWIDSLCIIQDDDDDWASEADAMANVYQHAFLVIAADGASHSGGGCFVRRNLYPSAIKIPFYDVSGQVCSSFWLSREMTLKYDALPSEGPLQQRGWALQETYLARRLVHFMPGGMSWECQGMSLDERRQMSWDRNRENWIQLLENYSRCELTYKKDRLPAIKGLASVMGEIKGVGYHMGILNVDIGEQLLWMLKKFASPSDTLDDVPSWTWASQGGQKIFVISAAIGGELANETAINLMMEQNGVLRFTGNLGKCDLHEKPPRFGHWGVKKLEYEEEALEDHDGGAFEEHEVVLAWLFSQLFERLEWQIIHGQDPTSQPIGFAATDEPYVGSCSTAFLCEAEWERIGAQISFFEDDDKYPPMSNHPSRRLHWVLLLVPASEHENTFRRIGIGAIWRDPEHSATATQKVTIDLV
ncbi:unnamed protein product [Clonostachys rosea]|uniref:Heterokaryon incompatibility domain-containing protein n=1 Tax=Bionectria ochroleuca TaxID=29856 RepID=A0ABY6TVA4_BIOOC|nr:unnamed protein product [Clonostachys rosea]